MAIKQGDKVKVHYTGTLDNGEVFDSSEGKEPLSFEVGSKQVIKGFEDAIIGMEKGQEKEIHLESSKAYGDVNPELTKKFPKDQIPEEVKVGQTLVLQAPNGMQIPAKVKEVTDKEITLDLNHPLAGKDLNFKIKIVEIN